MIELNWSVEFASMIAAQPAIEFFRERPDFLAVSLVGLLILGAILLVFFKEHAEVKKKNKAWRTKADLFYTRNPGEELDPHHLEETLRCSKSQAFLEAMLAAGPLFGIVASTAVVLLKFKPLEIDVDPLVDLWELAPSLYLGVFFGAAIALVSRFCTGVLDHQINAHIHNFKEKWKFEERSKISEEGITQKLSLFLKTAESSIDKVRREMESIQNSTDKVHFGIAETFDKRVDAMTSTFEGQLTSVVSTIEKSFGDSATKLSSSSESLAQSISLFSQQSLICRDQMKLAASLFSNLDERFEKRFEGTFSELKGTLSTLNNSMQKFDEFLRTHESSLKKVLKVSNEAIDQNNKTIQNASKHSSLSLDAVQSRLATIESSLTSIEEKVLSNLTEKVIASLGRMEERILNLSFQSNSLNHRETDEVIHDPSISPERHEPWVVESEEETTEPRHENPQKKLFTFRRK